MSILMTGIKSRHVVAVIASDFSRFRLLWPMLFLRSFSRFIACSRIFADSSADMCSFCNIRNPQD